MWGFAMARHRMCSSLQIVYTHIRPDKMSIWSDPKMFDNDGIPQRLFENIYLKKIGKNVQLSWHHKQAKYPACTSRVKSTKIKFSLPIIIYPGLPVQLLAEAFKKNSFRYYIPSKCQTDRIQIRLNICQAWSGSKLVAKVISGSHIL